MEWPIDIFPLPEDWPTYVPETRDAGGPIYDTVAGVEVEKHASFASRYAANQLSSILNRRLTGITVGLPFLACFGWEPERRRRPDVAYWPNDELLRRMPHDMDLALVPSFVAEAVPAEQPQDVRDAAIRDYLRAGVETVWRLDLYKRCVIDLHRDGTTKKWTEDEAVDGVPILKGQSLHVGLLFKAIEETRA